MSLQDLLGYVIAPLFIEQKQGLRPLVWMIQHQKLPRSLNCLRWSDKGTICNTLVHDHVSLLHEQVRFRKKRFRVSVLWAHKYTTRTQCNSPSNCRYWCLEREKRYCLCGSFLPAQKQRKNFSFFPVTNLSLISWHQSFRNFHCSLCFSFQVFFGNSPAQ